MAKSPAAAGGRCDIDSDCLQMPCVDRVCREYCDPSMGASACGFGFDCVPDDLDPAIGACVPDSCDLLEQDCDPGEGCYPATSDGSVAICARAGSLDHGDSCVQSGECAAGLICVMFDGFQCAVLCDLSMGDDDCLEYDLTCVAGSSPVWGDAAR